jgi:hypothetical protein
MRIKDVFFYAIKVVRAQRRIALIVYFIQFCLALTLGMQVYGVFESSIGNSLEIKQLLKHYDHTVISDFLKVHGASITPLIGQLRWLLLVWLIFAVFLDAGLLYCATNPSESNGKTFWQSGATYFFSFFKISLIFLGLALVWLALILGPLLVNLQASLQYFSTEKSTVLLVVLALALYLLGLAVLMIWSILSRFTKIKTGASITDCLRSAWKQFFAQKSKYLGLIMIFGAFQMCLIGLYWLIEAFTGMTSPMLILLLFVVQQVFAFFRVQLRQVMYASVYFKSELK